MLTFAAVWIAASGLTLLLWELAHAAADRAAARHNTHLKPDRPGTDTWTAYCDRCGLIGEGWPWTVAQREHELHRATNGTHRP